MARLRKALGERRVEVRISDRGGRDVTLLGFRSGPRSQILSELDRVVEYKDDGMVMRAEPTGEVDMLISLQKVVPLEAGEFTPWAPPPTPAEERLDALREMVARLRVRGGAVVELPGGDAMDVRLQAVPFGDNNERYAVLLEDLATVLGMA